MKYKIDGEEIEFENVADYMEAIKQSETQFNAYSEWTPEEDRELLRLLETDMTQKDIAYHFKRTPGSISSRKGKLEAPSVFVARMEQGKEDVRRFVKAIAQGVNPLTGEILDKNSAWLHPAILEDLKEYFEIDD